MATIINVYFGISEINRGTPDAIEIAPLHDPIKPVTVTGDFKKFVELTVPAGEVVKIWDYDEHDLFELIALVIQGQEGYLNLAWMVNKAVSDTDYSEDGTTHRRTCQADMSCFAPFTLSSDDCLVNPVLADATGVDGDGVPLIFSDAGTIEGRVYGLWAKNPGTDAVIVSVYVRN